MTRDRIELSRRHFLRLVGAAAAALPAARLVSAGESPAPPIAPFLDPAEYDIVRAATARIFPTGTTPGAIEAGVADYIQGMLSMLPSADGNCDGRRGAADFLAVVRAIGSGDSSCPEADVNGDGLYTEADAASVQVSLFQARPTFAGGPFSGRHPFVDPQTMAPSNRFPRDAFLDFAPLNRVQRLAWKARIEGTAEIPELAGNPLASGARVNLRAQYRTRLAEIEALSQQRFGASFVALTPAQQSQILATPSLGSFLRLLGEHTMEGLFAAPEYGGNRDTVGWRLIGYGGDSHPLGYTLGFDEESGTYVERAEAPNSRPNPDEDCVGLSPKVLQLIKALVSMQPEFTEFPEPFCFGVPA